MLADVFEQDLSLVRAGQSVKIHVDAYPEKELTGKVAYIYPTINPETRTAKVRIELANQDGMLRPDMFAKVELVGGDTKSKVLAVPDSAVIDSGMQQVVLIQRSEGLFEPREVKLGKRNDGYTEVLNGLVEGDVVVVSANFLIDAESNLKAALSSFGSQTKATVTKSSTDYREGK
jgi:Cu(I)/Ag(I) efflux system membrane fusion protein